jgi:glycosyltransferase involved in cell wall biosynthesis
MSTISKITRKVADDLTADSGSETPSFLVGKRVAMVAFSLYPSDPRVRRAAEALLKEGMTLDLICEAEDDAPRKETSGRLEVLRIPVRHHRGGFLSYAYQYFMFILISSIALAWRSIRRRYDLVYVHNMPDILVLSALVPKWLGAKVILDQHDPMPELMRTIFRSNDKSLPMRILFALEKWSIARADLVITVNEACRRIFGSRSCAAAKIHVVMNAPDGNIFQERMAGSYPPRDPNAPFVVMYHGSLLERNGAGLAVDSMALVCSRIPHAELRLYGRSTPYLTEVMERVRVMGLDHVVRYVGPRRLEELVGDIQACDVGIVPNYLNEFTRINTPTRLFEYLSQGKPVIAPLTQGVTDYFSPGSLFYFEAGNANDLAERILEVYSDPAQAVRIAERGQEICRDHSWRIERKKLVGLTTSLVMHGRSVIAAFSSMPVNQV